jgi:signal transduction histidine kinase
VQFMPFPLVTRNIDKIARQALITRKNIRSLEFDFNKKVYVAEIIVADKGAAAAAAAAAAGVALIMIFSDITEEKHAEQRRIEDEKHRQEVLGLKKIDEMKTAFLNVTSHELKTPLTPTLIQAQLLQEEGLGKLNVDQIKSIEIIIRNMKQLQKLIDDVLDISRIQSGTMKLEPTKTSLDKVLNEVVDSQKLKVGSRNVTLAGRIMPMPVIWFDDGRIRQVVRNLINNAGKFTLPGGTITVSAKKVGDSLQVDVSDTGRGIRKEHISKLFQPFFQVKESYKMKEKGRGLGLSICKGIIEAHGGKIWVESTYGKGSKFHFSLPIKPKLKSGMEITTGSGGSESGSLFEQQIAGKGG